MEFLVEIKVGDVTAKWDEYYEQRLVGDHMPEIQFKDASGFFMTVPTVLIEAIARQL